MNTNFNFRYEYFALKDSSLILKYDSLIVRMRLHPSFFYPQKQKKSIKEISSIDLKEKTKYD